MAEKKEDINKLITDVKLWKKDWDPKVATGYIVLGGCIQVDVALVKHDSAAGGYFVSWPRRKGEDKETGAEKWYDQVKPIDDEGKIDKGLGNEISAIVIKAYEALEDIPF